MSQLLADLRFGLRLLRATPIASAAAILSLALGIGGTTAMFAAVDAVLLRPLPYADPDRLVSLYEHTPARERGDFSPGNFLDMRSARLLEGVTAAVGDSFNLTGDGPPEQLRAQTVAGNFFTLLGASPLVGRTFRPDEDAPGTPARVVLSEGLWQRRFGGDRGVLGRMLTLAGQPVEVVGVMPASFAFDTPADIWLLGDRGVPRFTNIPGDMTQNRDVRFLTVIARLKPGVTLAAAEGELAGIATRLRRDYPAYDTGLAIGLEPLQTTIVGDTSRILLVLFGAVAVMLLIASVNVANLVLVRTQGRGAELAMRAALGAPRRRLAGQLMAESVVLAGLGGALGLGVAIWSIAGVSRLAPLGLPRLETIAVNPRIFLAALVATGVTGLAFGAWPAWRASRVTLTQVLQQGARAGAPRGRRRVQQLLVSSELAMAQVLVVAAVLLGASLMRLLAVSPGFDPDRLVSVDVSLPGARYGEPARKAAFHQAVLDAVAAAPGVDGVAMAMRGPLMPAFNRGVWFDGRPAPRPGEIPTMSFQTISERYFGVMGIPIRRGRGIAATDDGGAIPVVVVNEAFVARYFRDEDPIGTRIGYGDPKSPRYWRTIVGVVADARDRLAAAPPATAFAPFRQDAEPWRNGSYIVRSGLPATEVGAIVRRAVLTADPDQPVSRVHAIADDMADAVAVQRFTTLVAGLFAGLATLMALIGTFGVMSHVVATRTRELGVRLALGATRTDIVRQVVGGSAVLVGAAAAVGLAVSILGARVLQGLLYEVQGRDPWLLTIAGLGLGTAAIAASYLPVRQALRRDPVASLRRDA
jgi:putative ABC transport system permease protein